MWSFYDQTMLEKLGWNLTRIFTKSTLVYQESLRPLARVQLLTGLGLESQLWGSLSSILSSTFKLAKRPLSPFLCKFILTHCSQVAKIIKQHSWKSHKTTKAARVHTGPLAYKAQKKDGIHPRSNHHQLCPNKRRSFPPLTFRTRLALYSSSWKSSHITEHSLNYFISTMTHCFRKTYQLAATLTKKANFQRS